MPLDAGAAQTLSAQVGGDQRVAGEPRQRGENYLDYETFARECDGQWVPRPTFERFGVLEPEWVEEPGGEEEAKP